MGLYISVDGRGYYSWSYGSLHRLRLFAAQIEFPDITDIDGLYARDYTRFKTLIDHSDCGYGYVPKGVRPPYKPSEPETPVSWAWPSSEGLLAELNDLAQYKNKMDADTKEMFTQILSAAKASIRKRKPIEFT